MDRPAGFDTNNSDVVAWMILGYLCAHPDAKDTVDGVEKWWLKEVEFGLGARTVQGSLDRLVKWGWLVSRERQGAGVVYGLNNERRETLRQMFQDGEN